MQLQKVERSLAMCDDEKSFEKAGNVHETSGASLVVRTFFILIAVMIILLSGLIYMYALGVALYGNYVGAWPIHFLYYCLYIVALILPLENKLGPSFLIALAILLGFKFLFMRVANANVETLRTVLFVDGVPTLSGAIFQSSITIALLTVAAGFSTIVRDLINRIRNLMGLRAASLR
ncbi:MAG: hypothetical protein ABJ327_22955 [Litoreibacter sp.]